MQTTDAAGWYGKLPSLGDFASRRLDPDFLAAWDDWLAQGLGEWQSAAPDTWLAHYLAGPSWRFVTMPGALPAACGDGAWAGVLMPSVDRVGRYFPLTLAAPLARLPSGAGEIDALMAWLHRLDDLAVDALQEDWPVDTLEAELAQVGAPPLDPAGAATLSFDGAATADALRPGASMSRFLAGLAAARLHDQLQARTLWLADDAQGEPRLRLFDGLPRGADFSGLLGDGATPPSPSITL